MLKKCPKCGKAERERRSKRETHAKREEWRGMSHVIYKLKPGLKSLRKPEVLRVLEPAFRQAKERKGFRLIAWTLLHDHVHLIVEGETTKEVAVGLQGLAVSLTRRLNKLWGRVGKGSVFRDRHRKIPLRDYRHIRRAIAYVLGNARRHGIELAKGEPDRYSSAPWWRWTSDTFRRPLRSPPVAESRYIELKCGFMPQLDVDYRPGNWASSRVRIDFREMRLLTEEEYLEAVS
jgi:putative transposase